MPVFIYQVRTFTWTNISKEIRRCMDVWLIDKCFILHQLCRFKHDVVAIKRPARDGCFSSEQFQVALRKLVIFLRLRTNSHPYPLQSWRKSKKRCALGILLQDPNTKQLAFSQNDAALWCNNAVTKQQTAISCGVHLSKVFKLLGGIF
jgi:hypothetical protein